MRVRQARPEDLEACADISSQAFLDDELMAWLFPRRHLYYGDYRRECLREIQGMYYQPGFVMCVADLEDGDNGNDGTSHVVGFASWYRHGVSEAALKWRKDTISNRKYSIPVGIPSCVDKAPEIQRILQLIVIFVLNFVAPDRSGDPSRMEVLLSRDIFESIPERWHLSNIAVHPSYQRRGIAGQLTKWGLKMAIEERVPVTLEATISAEPLYRHLGFRDYSYNCLTEDVDGPALIWEPEGLEGSFGTNFPPRDMLVGRGKGRQWKPIDAYQDSQEL